MRGVVYLVNGDELVAMEHSLYDAEDVLQRLLATDGRLLGGAASGEASSRRWILIKREALVRGASGQQWSADHVFVDDEAVPTIVEVKRSTNTQLRREVVGQLLEDHCDRRHQVDDRLSTHCTRKVPGGVPRAVCRACATSTADRGARLVRVRDAAR